MYKYITKQNKNKTPPIHAFLIQLSNWFSFLQKQSLTESIINKQDKISSISSSDERMSLLATTMIKLAVFYVTAPSREVALKLCDVLLNQKLIACCNIVDSVQSVYLWQGKIENEKEVLMVLKSRQQLAEEITEAVIKNHPYDVPEVIAIPIVAGSKKYVDWVIESTKAPKEQLINLNSSEKPQKQTEKQKGGL